MIYISNGNSLNTFYGLSASNLYSCNSFTTDLYISGNVYGANLITANVTTGLNAATIVSGAYFGNGYGLSNLNASNLTGTISNANFPVTTVTPGTYGSGANVSQITVDQYGRLTAASNVGILSSQWTTVNGNVAYQNGVSVGTLSAPPDGSNLFVLGSANITDTLNVSTLYVNSATVFGSATLNVFGISNLNSVIASLYIGNASGLYNFNASNIIGNVVSAEVASSVTAAAQLNITSVGTLTGLTVNGFLVASNGSGISNLNSSNLVGNVAAANVASSVTDPAQTNITSVGTLSGLTVNGFLVASNGSGISNLNSSNLVGNVAAANVASSVTNPAQLNITSVGTLTGLTVAGVLTADLFSGNGSAISNITGASVVSTVGTAQSVTVAAQPNITSVGTLTSLSVTGSIVAGTISGSGQGLFGIHSNAIVDTVATANSVVQPAQPNITSVGTLTGLTVAGLLIASNGSGISNLNSSNLVGTISTGNFPTSGVIAGLYGSSVNVSSVTVDQYGRVTAASNVATQWTSNTGNAIYYANYVGIGATFVPTANLHVVGNAYVSNSVTTTNIFFTNTIQDTNLPTTAVTAGGYGSVSNIPQIVVDQYGRLTSASNIAFTATSQWTSVNSNVAFGNGVSIGTLTNPPVGSNLFVLGTANIDVINTSFLSISTLNLVSANITTANVATGNVVTANVGSLNVSGLANVSDLTVRTFLNVFSTANIANLRVNTLANLVSANVTTANVATANAVTAAIVTLNTSSTANIANLRVGTFANLATVNASSIFVTNSNIVTLNASSFFGTNSNIVTLNASSIFGTNSNLVNSNIVTGNVLTLNASSFFGTVSNLVTANVGTGNVLTLNASSIFGTNSNLVTANIGTGNVLTLNASSIFGTNSNLVKANITTGNILTLNASSIFGTVSNLVTANVTTGNVLTLNASSISVTNQANIFSSNLVTANVGTLNTGFLTVTSNILPGKSDGNTYLEGNIIVSGNVFSALGQPLGFGGSLYFSIGGQVTPSAYTGVLYGQALALSLNPFSIQGSSSAVTRSANGYLQFTRTGVYNFRGMFCTTADNITGVAVGSNVTDYGTRTDQMYVWRHVPFITQNPTAVFDFDFYVGSTTSYYYIDLFAVDSPTLQPTNNALGGTWLTVGPSSGGGGAGGSVTLTTLGACIFNTSPSASDYYVGVSNGMTVTIPLGASLAPGKQYIIKDESGLAGTSVSSRVTVAASGSDLIDGQTSLVIALNYGAINLIWTGTIWRIF